MLEEDLEILLIENKTQQKQISFIQIITDI